MSNSFHYHSPSCEVTQLLSLVQIPVKINVVYPESAYYIIMQDKRLIRVGVFHSFQVCECKYTVAIHISKYLINYFQMLVYSSPLIIFVPMNEELVFHDKGRPRVYNFDTLPVGEVQHITCKKSMRDRKLKSARSMCSINSIQGKRFRATATETGIAIKREA